MTAKKKEKTPDEIAAEEEKARADKESKRIEKEKRDKARSDYGKLLDDVKRLKEMIDTEAWRKFYTDLLKEKERARDAVLEAEKTRDIIRFQETVKILGAVAKNIRGPVDDLNRFCNDMPLFAQEFKVRASWNEGQGIVELSGDGK